MSTSPQLLRQLGVAAIDLPDFALGLLDILRLVQVLLQLLGGRVYGVLALAKLLRAEVLGDIGILVLDLILEFDQRADEVH